MTKDQLREKIEKGNYDREKLLSWVGCLPKDSLKVKPTTIKIGDVFMHPIFQHPCIVLKKTKEGLLMGLLTTEPTCPDIIAETQSRFFEGSYFTKVLFKTNLTLTSFLGVYDNNKHLKIVYRDLVLALF